MVNETDFLFNDFWYKKKDVEFKLKIEINYLF